MEKYTYIRKTVTWQNRRYEVRGKNEQEACDKLDELITSLKNTHFFSEFVSTIHADPFYLVPAGSPRQNTKGPQ